MRNRSSNRPCSIRRLAGVCLAATLLAGCGGGGDDTETTEPAGGSSVTAASPTSEPAATAASPTSGPAAEAGTLAVPAGGPTAVSEFPIPAGAQVVDLGPPLGGNWQFGISSPDSATAVEFYRTTLAAEGYTLRENVSIQVGVNTSEYDLAFFGTTYGLVGENEGAGGTLVTVDDRPINGLEP